MSAPAIDIRAASATDVPAIDALLRASFPSPDEAGLVRQLCVDGDMILMLVATIGDRLVGTVAFSRMEVEVAGTSVAAVALAPLAVDRDHRREGVGEALVLAGLQRLEQAGVVLCFVLGEPAYYARFGFAADLASGFASPYAGPYFMAAALQGGLMPCGARGAARHAGAFETLGAA